MSKYNHSEILNIIEAYDSSEDKEEILAKFSVTSALVKNWKAMVKRGIIKSIKNCELHNKELKHGTAQIKYGLSKLTKTYQISRINFPIANRFILREIRSRLDRNQTMETLYCEDCRKLEQNWIENGGQVFEFRS